jgi:hypothetical protein
MGPRSGRGFQRPQGRRNVRSRVQAIAAQRAGVDVDGAGTVMGASPPQMRGAVLGRLKAEFSLVAMKAGCLHEQLDLLRV